MNKPNQKAFTIVEVVVVIGVALLLLSILVVVFNSKMDSANDSKSISNLRSIGMASLLFANEHNGRLPFYLMTATIDQEQSTTWGFDAEWRSPIRCLFPSGKFGSDHPLGSGDYLDSTKVLYSPHLTAPKFKNIQEGELLRGTNGRLRIGYLLYSIPHNEAVKPAGTNIEMSNDRISRWEFTPLYSDIWHTHAELDGFRGKNVGVVHLNGSASLRSAEQIKAIQASTGWTAVMYYLATGRSPI